MARKTKVAVVYYSSTGNIHRMADRVVETAEREGAEVRLRRAPELAPQAAIDSNPDWKAHHEASQGIQEASPDDFEWADVVLLGSPTRYGNIAAQLKNVIDSLGPLWAQGKLADKVYVGFTSSQTQHGGQESTLLTLYNVIHHFGGIVVSPGYTDPIKFADGNPYGASYVSGPDNHAPVPDEVWAALEHLTQRALRVAAKLRGESATEEPAAA